MNPAAFRLLLLIVFFLSTFCVCAQRKYERRISTTEWINEIIKSQQDVYRLENAEIYDDYSSPYLIIDKERGLPRGISFSTIKKLELVNCKIVTTFYKCELNDVYLKNCEFDEMVTLSFDSCKFNGDVELFSDISANHVVFKNSIFISSLDIQQAIKTLWINDCQFLTDSVLFRDGDYKYSYDQLGIKYANYDWVEITGCNFQAKGIDPIYSLSLYGSTINKLRLFKLHAESLNLYDLTINKSIEIDSTTISGIIGIDNVALPPENTNIAWDILEGNKLALFPRFFTSYKTPYLGKTEPELANRFALKNLISSYNKFYSIYKTRGDRESANGVYIEMKALETRKLKYDYEQNKTMAAWFNWKLNKFLEVFCDYGTNPVKSLIISIYTILGFALLYFFFYSEWDKINQSFLINQHRKLMRYFRSEQNLEDFYLEYYKADLQEYAQYKEELEESKADMPYFLHLLGKPLYQVSLNRYKFMVWLYKRTEILHGRWVDLKPTRKIVVAGIAGTAVTFYVIYLALVRALNSIFLSLNTFSTLGFGDIPVTGISRYVAILEGFLGWFLLSIFSVSLISQILQI